MDRQTDSPVIVDEFLNRGKRAVVIDVVVPGFLPHQSVVEEFVPISDANRTEDATLGVSAWTEEVVKLF